MKVLLIDDEPMIREGLKSIIDWSKLGFEICGEAEDGKKGMEQILLLKPDIAIVDIKMPEMNGLEMIEKLKEYDINCEMIVLTAYTDFKFAQKSIELGIHSYILKPIEEDELREKVCKLRDEILNSRTQKQYINVGISLSREKVLQSLALGELCINSIEEYNRKYNFGFPWANYQIVLIDIYNTSEYKSSIINCIKNEVESFVLQKNAGFVFEINGYTAILIRDICIRPSNKLIADLHKLLLNKLGKDVVMILGPIVDSYKEIYSSCDHAFKLINKKFIYGHKRVISNFEGIHPEAASGNTSIDENDMITKLCTAIDVDNHDYINNITEEILTYFLSCDDNESIIKSRYAHMYLMIVNRIIKDNESVNYNLETKDVIDEIYKKDSLQELHGYFKYNIIYISEGLAKQRPENLVEKILDYINRNYFSDIKLEGLAEIFNYNSAYLGKLFKNSTGMSFNTYLDTVRVNKAKDMLKEGMKVYQVAEKTGYKDIAYFYKKFKKYAGVPPTNFKEKN